MQVCGRASSTNTHAVSAMQTNKFLAIPSKQTQYPADKATSRLGRGRLFFTGSRWSALYKRVEVLEKRVIHPSGFVTGGIVLT